MNMKKVFQVIMELIEIGERYIKKYRKPHKLKTETQPL